LKARSPRAVYRRTEFEIFDPVVPVRREPSHNAALDTEALKGERVVIYERDAEGWAWGQLKSDGYVGWLPDIALVQPRTTPTHKVTALRTFAFRDRPSNCPQLKSCRWALNFRSRRSTVSLP
jgi:hypothetical protein